MGDELGVWIAISMIAKREHDLAPSLEFRLALVCRSAPMYAPHSSHHWATKKACLAAENSKLCVSSDPGTDKAVA
jgi:hypothetical protein